jgi:hypothetical protein
MVEAGFPEMRHWKNVLFFKFPGLLLEALHNL